MGVDAPGFRSITAVALRSSFATSLSLCRSLVGEYSSAEAPICGAISVVACGGGVHSRGDRTPVKGCLPRLPPGKVVSSRHLIVSGVLTF